MFRQSGSSKITQFPVRALDLGELEVDGRFLVPRLTTAERNALSLEAGKLIFNLSSGKINIGTGSGWLDLPETTDTGGFDSLDVTGDITVGGTVDGVDIAALKADVDGFPDDLKGLTAAEIGQVANIGSTTISATQWGYVGVMNQSVASGSNVAFGNISVTGTVDGVDVALLDTKVTDLVNSAPNQGLDTTDSPTFASIVLYISLR